MKQAFPLFLTIFFVAVLLCSCSTTDEFFKTLNINYSPSEDSAKAPKTSKADLEKQLAAAKKREATLKERVAALEQEIGAADQDFNTQLAEIRQELNEEINSLRQELDEKEELISIQSRVIGLLDDADQTLQKSIEEQLRER